jgi:hypothetical protein
MLISDEWQLPAATERETWVRLKDHPVAESGLVMHYPWATLIDCCSDNYLKARSMLWEIQNQLSIGTHRITCCQHIRGFQYSFLFAACGLTDIFWPHTTISQSSGYRGLRFHAYPLFPVQRPDSKSPTEDSREILVSFKGAYDSRYYLTNSRQWIAEAPWTNLEDQQTVVEITDEWHFQKDVYDRQIKGNTLDVSHVTQKSERESSYRSLLANSLFSLCPSGSGPNSIRLWESIGFGSIPVLLADGLSLPWTAAGHPYETAVIPVIERQQSIHKLPFLLKELARDESFIKLKREEMFLVWENYWSASFARPIIDFVQSAGKAKIGLASPSYVASQAIDFVQSLDMHLRSFLHFAAQHPSLRSKWPSGLESIASFVLEAKHGVEYGAENIKAMLIQVCKQKRFSNPHLAILHLLSELS